MSRFKGSEITAAAVLLALSLATTVGLGRARAAGDGAPSVVVSLKPLHSLVAGVMGDVGAPRLLIPGSASPHAYSLRPSDARALSEADLVFWVGRDMETFLARPLASLAGGAAVVALSTVEGVRLLKNRAGGAWDGEAGHGDEGEAADEHAYHHGEYNLHIWLDPDNAIAIVQAAVSALSHVDPDHAADYATNGEALIGRLTALDRELHSELAPVRQTPFVVFHDAYQYFEAHYGLNAVGSITVSPDRAPGASRVSEIRRKIKRLEAACVFSEPQFTPTIVRTLIEGTAARQGMLDPLGVELQAGPDAYFALMRGLGASLRKCLAPAS